MDLSTLTVESTRTAIAERVLNPVELVEEFYKKIEADDPQIGAYLTLAKDRALRRRQPYRRSRTRAMRCLRWRAFRSRSKT